MNEIRYPFLARTLTQQLPPRPCRVLILTSIRDVGVCDRNGTHVLTPGGLRYMMGATEHLIRASLPGGALHGLIEVVSIITDDHISDLVDTGFGAAPSWGEHWIFPTDGELTEYAARVKNIPSLFRKLPRSDRDGRVAGKLSFEQAILDEFMRVGADIVLSDHYMAKLEHLINGWGLYGRVLNIHPAVTDASRPFCFRGPTPTTDAITLAGTNPAVVTGATLHLINHVIDDGQPIMVFEGTTVNASDEPQHLRLRNYQMAKLPLLTAGLTYYVCGWPWWER